VITTYGTYPWSFVTQIHRIAVNLELNGISMFIFDVCILLGVHVVVKLLKGTCTFQQYLN